MVKSSKTTKNPKVKILSDSFNEEEITPKKKSKRSSTNTKNNLEGSSNKKYIHYIHY